MSTTRVPALFGSEKVLKFFFYRGLVDDAGMCRCDVALAIDQQGSRQGIDTAIEVGDVVVTQHNRVIHGVFAKVRLENLPAFVIERDAEDFEAVGFVLRLEVHKPGDFLLAADALGGPEIQQHNLAFVAGEADFVSLRVLKGEAGRGFVGLEQEQGGDGQGFQQHDLF